MPLIRAGIPSNLYYFYQLVIGSLKFDFLFTSDLVENSFKLKDIYPAYCDTFDEYGYNSMLAI